MGSADNPVQAAHRIPFGLGVVNYGFTPDWLDRQENLGWACRSKCNSSLEWDSQKIVSYLDESSLTLPLYLDEDCN
jgi:hypothetical protein